VVGRVALADEIAAAYASRRLIAVPPTAREGGLELPMAYAVEAELVRRRRASGHTTVGWKVGYANKAAWRVLKLDTLAWAHMYDDTVRHAVDGHASLSTARMTSPKIEPEIVFKLASAIPDGTTDASAVLAHVEWLALGFEIIDCVYADWKFEPVDFVAAYGLHAGLVVGTPTPVGGDGIPGMVEALATFKVFLAKGDAVVAEGTGKNSLRSPALCLAELAAARTRQAGQAPLKAGDLISSGSLTESQPIAPGDRWSARVEGLDAAPLSLAIDG
jgi:2-oxo-3-hexenedioate decarboxylase